ncbi:MAG: acyltransferase [Pseudonocardiales bacterium]|nr:acyltransferase [Pseudonocardiales bacterium]
MTSSHVPEAAARRWRARASDLPAGQQLVKLVRWRRDVWADLRLRLLSDLGHIPSHRVRDLFYRRSGLALPKTSSIHWRAEFYAPERIIIGQNCIVGDSCFFDGRSGITLGDNVNIGGHVTIFTRQHDVDSPDFMEVGASVFVGEYAWIASHSIVLPGVSIGRGAVVAAGSVVTKDVPEYTLVGGNPAHHIRDRNRDLRYRLNYAKRFV